MDYLSIAHDLSANLGLTSPPIGLSFVGAVPEGIPLLDQEVPSACTFWRKAESQVFYAPAQQHANCPIGMLTMGLSMPDDVRNNLMDAVRLMTSCGYLAMEEAEKIPSIAKEKVGIVYGPLSDMPLEPDLVLLWLTPRQAMLYAEAAGSCRWTESTPTAVLGRPACAALPVAWRQGRPALSLGCTGMRTYTDISENRLLGVLTGDKLPEFSEALASTLEANETMRTFYEGRKSQFAGSI